MQRLTDYLTTADIEGLDLDEGDIITGAVIILRTHRLDDRRPAVVVATDADWITMLGLLHAAVEVQGMEGE